MACCCGEEIAPWDLTVTSFPWVFGMEPWCSGNFLPSSVFILKLLFRQCKVCWRLQESPQTHHVGVGSNRRPRPHLSLPFSNQQHLCLWGKFTPLPNVANMLQVLLDYCHTHSSLYCLLLCPGCCSTLDKLQRELLLQVSVFTIWPSAEPFCAHVLKCPYRGLEVPTSGLEVLEVILKIWLQEPWL